MRVVVLTNERLKKELLAQCNHIDENILWVNDIATLQTNPGADVYLDLLFENNTERIFLLQQLQPAIVLVNAVAITTQQLPAGFIRFNGWNTLLKRSIVEIAGDEKIKETISMVFSFFNKTIEWVTDTPGFITARVISMIINEAYFALHEGVSSKKEIDIAMKLGTNYPYGPFEWSEEIGLKNVAELLFALAVIDKKYLPAELLQQEVLTV